MMHQIYISYTPLNEPFAHQLANDLRLTGPRIWLGIQNGPDENWTASVEQALSESVMMIVILSPESVESPRVAAEWQTYLDLYRPVIPVIAQPCTPPEPLLARRPIDFTRDYRRALHQLIMRLLEYRARTRTTDAIMGGLAEQVQDFRDEQKPGEGGIRRIVQGLYGRLRGG